MSPVGVPTSRLCCIRYRLIRASNIYIADTLLYNDTHIHHVIVTCASSQPTVGKLPLTKRAVDKRLLGHVGTISDLLLEATRSNPFTKEREYTSRAATEHWINARLFEAELQETYRNSESIVTEKAVGRTETSAISAGQIDEHDQLEEADNNGLMTDNMSSGRPMVNVRSKRRGTYAGV